MSSKNISQIISQHEVFKNCAQNIIDEISNSSYSKKFTKNQAVYFDADNAEYIYLIKSGWVKIFTQTLDGTETILDILTEGHIFAERALFNNNIYDNNAQAVEDSELVMIPAQMLGEILLSDSKLSANMLRYMTTQQKHKEKEIEHLTIQNAPQRIGCFILRLCPHDKERDIKLHLPYDKLLIASRLGMKPETFSRALSSLKEKTGIRIKGASVEIDDISTLSGFSCNFCSSEFPCDEHK